MNKCMQKTSQEDVQSAVRAHRGGQGEPTQEGSLSRGLNKVSQYEKTWARVVQAAGTAGTKVLGMEKGWCAGRRAYAESKEVRKEAG